MASLKDQLKELQNPNPTFKDPEEEYESLTSAKLTSIDAEKSAVNLDNRFGSIRNKVSATLLQHDEKYQGSKISRRDFADEINLWDKFLEMRIKLQKCLQLSNKHPQHDTLPEFKKSSGAHLAKSQGDAKVVLKTVLDKLLSLQDLVYSKNPELSGLLTGEKVAEHKDVDSDEEIPSDTDEETEGKDDDDDENDKPDADQQKITKKRKLNLPTAEYEKELSKRQSTFREFRDRTIIKWDEKTKLSSGKLRSKTFASFDRSVVAQIRQILSDKERLTKRTQLKRSIYRILGKLDVSADEVDINDVDSHLKNYDEEIFDDDDFYHQMIKELIERKSNLSNTSDPLTMGRQWLELQRWRKKAKRKVDVKASKGRRVRYNVHAKLVNFMTPVPAGTMSDQARNDLFSSLFGKRGSESIT
eukprot:gene3224-3702_t